MRPLTHRASSDALAGTRHVSPARVVVVTLGLIGLGAVAGGVAGALGVAVWLGITEGLWAAFDTAAWTVAGVVGAACGAVLLPLAGFTVLRYVPLGRVLSHTVLATALGGIVGIQFLGEWWLAGPLAGFGIAAGRLWLLARRARAAKNRAPEVPA